ncbi:MerR family transcriptional regulator [Paenibacillus sp. WQ 127069]|uniref:MerR family transcriptional regulator n=1 Tax=Paenibacillus baimaensis TaxID=2982185 RepID=A0ABT2ULR2_9BACL|nr:MerR family transcriptional regulator [Paenibacillus sp. WQ 127069]MCU6795590.1 MerR family transcriptional regulator [Paenibacillus sp. WQ 127069]
MYQTDMLSISAFSKMSDVTRKTLIYYDRIGLFKPAFVADNGYRYYHRSQLDTIGVIHIFKELGMSLEEIRGHLGKRTPASTLELLRKQEEIIQLQIAKLEQTRQMIIMQAENIELSINVNTSHIQVIWQSRIPLLLSCRVHASKKQFPEYLWDDFQLRLQRENAPIGYPNGIIVKKEDLLKRDGDMVSHMFSRMATHFQEKVYMPEGFYLVSYTRADYGDTDKIYPQIFDYIEKKQYVVLGDAYEEYLQDEVSLQNPEEYLVRIMVHIKEPSNDK